MIVGTFAPHCICVAHFVFAKLQEKRFQQQIDSLKQQKQQLQASLRSADEELDAKSEWSLAQFLMLKIAVADVFFLTPVV